MASGSAKRVAPVDIGIASFAASEHEESGDLSVSSCMSDYALIAAIDGIGHGKNAAAAAHTAAAVLEASATEPLVSLLQKCHEVLRNTRGVVLSVAFIDFSQSILTWIGVGNVQGFLLRSSQSTSGGNGALLLRPGVVGSQLPMLQTATLPISAGDVLAFATDGIRGEFLEDVLSNDTAQRSADRILAKHCKGTDDALILLARFMGGPNK
jgi:phosphoserine phosphatase RsbX